MIDNPLQVDRLLGRLESLLPIEASPSPRLTAYLDEQHLNLHGFPCCRITAVLYAGNEGGITCKLEIADRDHALFVSITHLMFRPKHPLAREIAAYQKHRIKRMRLVDADRPSQGRPKIVAHTYF